MKDLFFKFMYITAMMDSYFVFLPRQNGSSNECSGLTYFGNGEVPKCMYE